MVFTTVAKLTLLYIISKIGRMQSWIEFTQCFEMMSLWKRNKPVYIYMYINISATLSRHSTSLSLSLYLFISSSMKIYYSLFSNKIFKSQLMNKFYLSSSYIIQTNLQLTQSDHILYYNFLIIFYIIIILSSLFYIHIYNITDKKSKVVNLLSTCKNYVYINI